MVYSPHHNIIQIRNWYPKSGKLWSSIKNNDNIVAQIVGVSTDGENILLLETFKPNINNMIKNMIRK
jgi:hypothetical protein